MNLSVICDHCGKSDSDQDPIMISSDFSDVRLCEKCDYIQRNEIARTEIQKMAQKEGISVSEWQWNLEQKLKSMEAEN